MNDLETAEKPSKKAAADILSLMRSRLDSAIGAMSETRTVELDDLRFAAGNSDNNFQWPDAVLNARTVSGSNDTVAARPCLTINKLPQHIKQVTNEQRLNRPAPKVIPANDEGSVDVAEVYNGMIRQIESASQAEVAYATACENQVTFGEGYIRILTEFVDENSFDQEILIRRVRNSFSVYMDPMIQDPCGQDADWASISEELTHKEYESKYPKASLVSTLSDLGVGDNSISVWVNADTIRIMEYFYIDSTPRTLNLYEGAQTAFDGTPEDVALKEMYGKPIRKRNSPSRQVKWIKTNGYDILESNDWAGKYIPIVRVIGNEFEIDGRVYISGIVRNAKDPQRMYNYWSSQECEMLALAPKAPFIGYAGQFEGYEKDWQTANTKNHPYLQVNPDVTDGEGRVLPLPQRAQPPMVQSGIIAAKQAMSEDIKETTGQYNASLGMQSNERSGKAILARQTEGDKSTYHYVSNLALAVQCVGRQLIDLIPKIYDTARVARILGEDGESKMVKLNPDQPEAMTQQQNPMTGAIEKIYNPNVGKYDIRVITGPSYASKRMEAAASMAEILQTNPEMWGIAGDLFVKNMDWPGAQEIAKRIAKGIDPKLMADEDDPATQAAQAKIQELTQQLQQAMQMLKSVSTSMEGRELSIKEFQAQLEARKIDIMAYDAETKRITATSAGMTMEQIQDIVQGTIDGALHTGDLAAPTIPDAPQMPPQEPMPQMEQPQQPPMEMM